jgi:ligand-binding sensor domain-containing protein
MKFLGPAAGVAWMLASNLVMWGASAPSAGRAQWRLSQLSRRVWQIEDGLAHNYVTAVATDDDGYLLLGTQSGIVRSDGMRLTPFPYLVAAGEMPIESSHQSCFDMSPELSPRPAPRAQHTRHYGVA